MTSTGSTSSAAGTAPAQAQAAIELPIPRKTMFFVTPEVASYFVAGGCAGAASRTVVSPLERLKIIQQVQPRGVESQYKGVWSSLVGLSVGAVAYLPSSPTSPCLCTVLNVFDLSSAVQFTTYEQLKKWFTRHGSRELDTPKRLASGALAGITSVCSTYPLDLVRSRLSIATASVQLTSPTVQAASKQAATTIPSTQTAKHAMVSAYHTASAAASTAYTKADLTIWGMTLKIVREEGGIKALYRGLVTTAVGVAPYVGINFAAYEFLRGIITPPGKSSVPRKLACGALAGSISQTLTYPFDVLRRKMQVTGMRDGQIKYNGAIDAMKSIIRVEGVAGMYRGLWPNLPPSIATSFFTYELVKEFLVPK
ncbi:hypothetical protein NLJ89_g3414 [Agrocybe chaxingu]|uniref:Mitochondrial carrier n=1 Tax=Agrocybe chaxingu TaxID=84603 RepID=A0A9W8K5B3_9AGAR|nr:hypothetical protein NLJ89_g3414 [Agrocybe chaxingu]